MNIFRIPCLLLFSGMLAFSQDKPFSEADFLKALGESDYQCSYLSYSKLKFGEKTLTILDEKDKEKSTGLAEVIEPGIIKKPFRDGKSIWFVFAEDLETFIAMHTVHEHPATISGGKVSLENHDTWSGIEIDKEVATPILKSGGNGQPFPLVKFNEYGYGAFYKNTGIKGGVASALVISRSGKTAWWLEGFQIASGAKTFRNRDAKALRRSPNTESVRRTNQFAWYLLKMGKLDQAFAHERYAEYYLLDKYGEDSEKTIEGLRIIGELRASANQHKLGPYWIGKARDLAKKHLQDEPEKILEYEVELAWSQYQAGDYDGAMKTLKSLPQQPDLKKQFERREYDYANTISGIAFAQRDYDKAATWQKLIADESVKYGHTNWVKQGWLRTAAAFLAKGDSATALIALNSAIDVQEKLQKEKPRNYETHELSFACSALEQWDAALKYSSEGNFKSYYEFEEVAKLLALWNQGNKRDAMTLARKIRDRFPNGLDSLRRTDETHEMFIALIDVLSEPDSSIKVNEFRKVWSVEKERLKVRPLHNFLFYRLVAKADSLL